MRLVWSAEDLLRAVRGQSLHMQDWMAHGISTDSRTLQTGDVFVALGGGHNHVREAFEKGAAAALVSRQPPQAPPDKPLIFVDDTSEALHDLGSVGRARTQAQIVAVTGSVGKSCTKDMLRLMLGAVNDTCANEDDCTTPATIPLALARLPQEARFGIIEAGLSGKDKTAATARDIRPHLAVVTNIEAANLALFSTLEATADAACQFFTGMDSQGVAIVNRDAPSYARLLAAARTQGLKSVFSFGEETRADARLLNVVADDTGSQVECSLQGVRLHFRLGAPGRHLVQDALAALLACAALGADITLCAETLEFFRLPARRGARQNLTWGDGSLTLIDESAEASPASLKAAIAVLGQAPAGRRIALLGDMENLGAAASGLHAALAESLVENGIDSVHCCGEMMTHLHDALPGAMRGMLKTDSAELAPLLAAELRAGDTVLIKGSRGQQMERIVKAVLAAAQGESIET